MTVRQVHVHPYRSWRAWYRSRWRTRCQVCGATTTGHLSASRATVEGWRHLAWHELVDRVLGEWEVPEP